MGQTSSQIKPTQDDDDAHTDVDAANDAKPQTSDHGSESAMMSENDSKPAPPVSKHKRRRESESEPAASKKTKRARKETSTKRQKTHAAEDSLSEIEVLHTEQDASPKRAKKQKRRSEPTSEDGEAISPAASEENVTEEAFDPPVLKEQSKKKKSKRKAATDEEADLAASASEHRKKKHTSPAVVIEHLPDERPVGSVKKPKTKRKSAATQPDDEIPETQPSQKPAEKSKRKSAEMPPPPRPASRNQPQTPSNQPIQPLRIVTPSETVTPYVPAVMGVDATEQVQDWLQTQATPSSNPDRATPGRPPKRPDQTGVRGKPLTVLVDGPKKGLFTQEEKAVADAVLSACALQENISEYYLKCHIIDYLNVGHFKEDMKAALPNRTSTAIRKFCQRRYDLNTKGKWTEDEDQALLKAYTQYGNNWISISDIIGRSAQSCRDRYKNGLKYGSKRETGPWSTSEEAELLAAVEECIESVKLASKADTELLNDRSRLENSVAWNVVADKLGGRRPEKRCREKYAKLKQRGLTEPGAASAQPPPSTEAWDPEKFHNIEAEFETFKEGDLYDCLTEIHTAIKDHTAVYHEESTVWSIVSSKNPGSRFSSKIRRRAYHYAIENYRTKRILKATSIAGKARGVTKKLEKKMEEEGSELPRGYVPAVKRKYTKKEDKEKKEKDLNLSKEYVSESSDSEDEQADVTVLDVLRSQDAGTGKKLASAIKYRAESLAGSEQQESEEEQSHGNTATSDEDGNGHNFKRAQIATKSLQAHLKDPNGNAEKKKKKAKDLMKA